MLILFAAALLGQPAQAPSLQPGSTDVFQRACIAVEEKLEAGDFKAASALFQALPKEKLSIEWDDSKVPAGLRGEFAEARDTAIASWKLLAPNIDVRLSKPADIRVSFASSLPPNQDTPLPAGAVHFLSPDPKDPRVDLVISLSRGNPPFPVEAADVHNEVGHAIGLYFGIARTNHYSSFSSRSELPANLKFDATPFDVTLARKNLDAARVLQKMIHMQLRCAPARPRLQMDPARITGGTFVQGDRPEFTFQFTNVGNSTLLLKGVPDCGCVVTSNPGPLAPGATALYKVQVDTTEYVGRLDKKIVLYSNDPEQPMRTVPIELYAKPLYRILTPSGIVALNGPIGAKLEVYLALPEGSGLTPRSARMEGATADVAYEPWRGRLADPELEEPAAERSGFKFTVHYSASQPPGRNFSALVIETDSPKFPTLRAGLAVQTGIVAMPEQVFLGNISKAARRAFFLLSRPGKGFRIKEITSDNPRLTFAHRAHREDWEHRISLQLDGKLDFGLLLATIVVRTDDPAQPEIRVPFRANVQ